MHHAFLYHQSGPVSGLTYWLKYGHFAVDVFILISGYCLMLPVLAHHGSLRGGAIAFFQRRARRILPPYYFALALCLCLIWTLIGQKTGTHWDAALPATPFEIIAHLLLLQDVIGDAGRINYVTWSIAVEWQIYFLFPLMLVFWRRFGALRATVGITLVSYVLYEIVRGTPVEGITCQYFALFAFGMLAAEVSQTSQWPALKSPAVLRNMFAIAFAALVSLCHRWGISGHWVVMDLIVGIASFALLVGASLPGTNVIRQCLSWYPLVQIGTFAYSIYLVHAPILQIFWQYGIHPHHFPSTVELGVVIAGGLVLSIGGAYVFFWFCERPWLVQKRRETSADVTRDAIARPAP